MFRVLNPASFRFLCVIFVTFFVIFTTLLQIPPPLTLARAVETWPPLCTIPLWEITTQGKRLYIFYVILCVDMIAQWRPFIIIWICIFHSLFMFLLSFPLFTAVTTMPRPRSPPPATHDPHLVPLYLFANYYWWCETPRRVLHIFTHRVICIVILKVWTFWWRRWVYVDSLYYIFFLQYCCSI